MNGISIELGHIYQDMELNEDYLVYLKRSQNLISNLDEDNKTLKLLIDDLNISEKKWDEKDLILFLKDNEINVDILFYESKFASIAEMFISEIDNSYIKKERFRRDKKTCLFFKNGNYKIKLKTIYDNDDIEYSCVLLSALWQLCRLGFYKYPKDSYLFLNDKEIVSNKTITVIDNKYAFVEEQVLELVSIKIDVNLIKHYFI